MMGNSYLLGVTQLGETVRRLGLHLEVIFRNDSIRQYPVISAAAVFSDLEHSIDAHD